MIRQAHTYLVSAMSGATLIAIAIVVFVLLVSAQVFRDWPLAGLGGSDAHPRLSAARAAATPAAASAKASTAPAAGNAPGSSREGKKAAAQPATSAGDLATTGTPAPAGEPTGEPEGGPAAGDQGGSEAAPTFSPAASAPSSSNGSSGQSSSSPSGGGNQGSGNTTASNPSGKLTETVNGAVNQVDETVTGGTLGQTGVTEATEGVVNGVVGPESVVGKAVDETVGAVGGLLGGKR